VKRTTVLLDDALLIEAQALAEQRSMTFTSLISEAIRAYIQANRMPRQISCIGIGRSDRPRGTLRDGGDEAELRAGIDPVEGWSPQRRTRKDGERDGTNDAAGQSALPAPEH
jgi:predicted transcriptional regulator